MAGMDQEPDPYQDVKLYTIHVSSKYLNLTRQKLELTRLPHDVPQAKHSEWWEPKATVEPLVDYWLEKYSWRDQEAEFNANVPQFRTAIQTAGLEAPVRLHVIHSPSTHANAVPLLMIPPFPFTNLSLTHLIKLFTDPDNPADNLPFHLVIPSLPGMGFSDAITSTKRMIPDIADMFDILMKRLGYKHYLATNSGPSPNSLSDIDWRIANHLALLYPTSCLGVHFVSPPLQPPTLKGSPIEWLKWKTVTTLQTPSLGYTKDDMKAFRTQGSRDVEAAKITPAPGTGRGSSCAFEPNTLSYALCDSPSGMLLFILTVLRLLGPRHQFTPRDIIQIAELTWLPGPEGTMRLWAHCASHPDDLRSSSMRKPKVAVTTFLGDEKKDDEQSDMLPASGPERYACPAWGRSKYNIISTQRVTGNSGLLAWERPSVLLEGIRGLAKAITKTDNRLQKAKEPGIALLEQVVTEADETAPAEISGTTLQAIDDVDTVESVEVQDHHSGSSEGGRNSTTATGSRRPQTPLFPSTGDSSQELIGDEGDANQSSSSPSTIIPFTGNK